MMGCEHCEESLSWMHCVLSTFKKNNMNVYVLIKKVNTLHNRFQGMLPAV